MDPQENFRRQLVENNLGLVHRIASDIGRSTGNRYPSEDLVHIGTLGLMEAARRYDPSRGCQFSTFAYYRIRGAILDGMRSLTEESAVRRVLLAEERASSYLQEATLDMEVRPGFSMEEAVERLMEGLSGVAACHVLSSEGAVDNLRAPESETPHEQAERNDARRCLKDAIRQLPPSLREVIHEIYHEEKTMEAVAAARKRSKTWVSRTHAKAIRALQEIMRSP